MTLLAKPADILLYVLAGAVVLGLFTMPLWELVVMVARRGLL